MATVAAIRTALQTRLKSINGLQVYSRWPANVNVPCVIIRRGVTEPEQNLGTGTITKYMFELYVLASLSGGYEQAQDNIDPYLATSSTGGIYGAINADRTLGGVVAATFVKAFSEDDQLEFSENMTYQSFKADVECWAS